MKLFGELNSILMLINNLLSSKHNSVDHCAKAFHDIFVHGIFDIANQVLLRVHLTYACNVEVLQLLLILLLNPLFVIRCQLFEFIHCINCDLLLLLVVFSLQIGSPALFVQILKHSLLDITLPVVDGD